MRVTLLAAARRPSRAATAASPTSGSAGSTSSTAMTELVDATVQHIAITVAAVLLGVVIAFPVALLARRLPRLEAAILGVSTGIYTIPSLALFPLLVPFTGLSPHHGGDRSRALRPDDPGAQHARGTASVPDDVVESATGLGYGAEPAALRIELPLALPVIMAGLRVATVSTVALTTVGSIVAYGGLGNLIADGVLTQLPRRAVDRLGAVRAAGRRARRGAGGAQRLLTPWTRGGRRHDRLR